MTTSHLKRKRQGWYARLVVPPQLRAAVGKRELLRTLNTRDIAEANRRKHAILAEMQRELSSAAVQMELSKDSPAYILGVAKAQRQAKKDDPNYEPSNDPAMDVAVEGYLDRLRAKFGTDPETGDPMAPDEYTEAVQQAYSGADLLSDHVHTYLEEVGVGVRKQTVLDKRRALKEFSDWLKRDVEPRAITKQVAGRYVSEVLAKKGWSPKTIKTTLSHFSALWTWLDGRGAVEGNPWLKMSGTLTVSKRGKEAPRRGWSDDELSKLLRAIPKADPLFSITAIAAYTGMRREEVCQLKVSDVVNGALKVREGKSAAAIRDVPLHPALHPLVDSLATSTKDGYLIPGLLTGGADGKRGHMEGKRFGYLIRKLGFSDPALDFHALRYSFTDRCRQAGVPESTADLLTGHERPGKLSYGSGAAGYSQSLPLDILAREVSKVTYGALDGYLKEAGGAVRVVSKARRRPRARKVAT